MYNTDTTPEQQLRQEKTIFTQTINTTHGAIKADLYTLLYFFSRYLYYQLSEPTKSLEAQLTLDQLAASRNGKEIGISWIDAYTTLESRYTISPQTTDQLLHAFSQLESKTPFTTQQNVHDFVSRITQSSSTILLAIFQNKDDTIQDLQEYLNSLVKSYTYLTLVHLFYPVLYQSHRLLLPLEKNTLPDGDTNSNLQDFTNYLSTFSFYLDLSQQTFPTSPYISKNAILRTVLPVWVAQHSWLLSTLKKNPNIMHTKKPVKIPSFIAAITKMRLLLTK